MAFGLDWLRTILPKTLKLKGLNKIKLFSDINSGNKTYVDKRTLVINLGQLSADEKKKILSGLPLQVKEGVPVLESGYVSKIEDYKTKIQDKGNQDLIDFYSGKIPPQDLLILKASLYLRSVLRAGGETINIKNEIVQRFGSRGRNISNLCSANYYDNEIKELYEKMASEHNFSNEKFLEIYEYIVEAYPFAIFISKDMSKEIALKAVKDKIESNKKYGFNYLNLHGIGSDNIDKINYVLESLEKELKLTSKEIKIEGTIAVIRVEFETD